MTLNIDCIVKGLGHIVRACSWVRLLCTLFSGKACAVSRE